jgi:hypothetical protein
MLSHFLLLKHAQSLLVTTVLSHFPLLQCSVIFQMTKLGRGRGCVRVGGDSRLGHAGPSRTRGGAGPCPAAGGTWFGYAGLVGPRLVGLGDE